MLIEKKANQISFLKLDKKIFYVRKPFSFHNGIETPFVMGQCFFVYNPFNIEKSTIDICSIELNTREYEILKVQNIPRQQFLNLYSQKSFKKIGTCTILDERGKQDWTNYVKASIHIPRKVLLIYGAVNALVENAIEKPRIYRAT